MTITCEHGNDPASCVECRARPMPDRDETIADLRRQLDDWADRYRASLPEPGEER